jgi:aspartyl-tRNA(Asn)/glutamyl-tRNA(Gln) amidotransferase subunit A
MDINTLTVKKAHEDLKAKKYSSRELTQEFFSQIDDVDEKVKAFVSRTEEVAFEKADKFDNGEYQDSMIGGVPGSLKDLLNMEGSVTTASTKTLADFKSPYNSNVAEQILKSGGVVLGKTNMDAFAHGSSTEKSDFFVTHNPWDLERLPGGSSGGAAAAVAARMGLWSIGSETAGSIRQPASWTGTTGLKPTYGRVSRYGGIAMGSSLDCPGPICKTAEDCAILLDVIAGHDPRDATSSSLPVGNYFKNLKKDIEGIKIGLPRQYFDKERIEPEVLERVMCAVKELENMGAVIVDMDLMDPKYGVAVYTVICRIEVASNLGRYDGIRYGYKGEGKYESVLDQITHTRGEAFGQEAKQRSMTGAYAQYRGISDQYYQKAQKVRTLIKQDLERAFKEVDIIIGPSTPSTALKIGATEGNPLFGEMADILIESSTLAGNPGISIPVGFDSRELPVGMNIFAPQFAEQLVLNLSHAYQSETDWHFALPKLLIK